MPNRNSPNQPGSNPRNNYTPVKGTPSYYKGGDGRYYSYASRKPIPKPAGIYAVAGVGEFDRATSALIRGTESGGSAGSVSDTKRSGSGGGSNAKANTNSPSTKPTDNQNPSVQKVDPGKDFLKDKKILKYPTDLFENSTDYLRIQMLEYEPTLSINSAKSSGEVLSTFYCYMPRNLSTSYATNWGGANISPNGRALVNAIGMAIRGGEGAKGSVGKYLQNALKGTDITFGAAGIAKGVSQMAPGTNLDAQSILGLSQGLGINSTVEIFWSGHGGQRTMSFSIVMSPRSKQESETIRDIVKAFKVAMHPGSNGASGAAAVSSRFVTYPYMFKISYMSGSKEHEFLNKFKESVLESVSVDYTPDGSYTTLENTSPVATVMTLNFKELRHIYREDIIESKGAGY